MQLLAAGALALGLAGIAVGALYATGVLGGGTPSITEVVRQAAPRTAFVGIRLNGEPAGNGSGWIWDAEKGLVVTNWHVVNAGDAYAVRIGNEQRERPAELVAAATCEDLAVLRIADTAGLEAMPLGSQEELRQGDAVVTLGYPGSRAEGSPLTANQGVVSVVRTESRDLLYTGKLPNVIQIDAQFNPGNSGGPAVDLEGDLVGVTTFVNPAAEYEGQRYLIGVDRVKEVVPTLAGGTSLGWTGLRLDSGRFYDLTQLGLPQVDGILVTGAFAGTPAEAAGVPVPSLIVAVNGTPVTGDIESYCAAAREARAGESVVLTVVPAGSSEPVDVTVPFA